MSTLLLHPQAREPAQESFSDEANPLGVAGIEFIHFGAEDVVRHPLVQRIVSAYEREDSKRGDRDSE